MRKAKQDLLNKPSKLPKKKNSAAYFSIAWDKKNAKNTPQIESQAAMQKSNGPARKRSGSAINHGNGNESKLCYAFNHARECIDMFFI